MNCEQWIRYIYSEMRYYVEFKQFRGIQRTRVGPAKRQKERRIHWTIMALDPPVPLSALDPQYVPLRPENRRTVVYRIVRTVNDIPVGDPSWRLGTVEDFATSITSERRWRG